MASASPPVSDTEADKDRLRLEYRYRHRNLGAIVLASPYKILYSYVALRSRLLAYGNINLYINLPVL